MSAKKIVVVNQTSTDIQIRITNPFRAFGNETIKMGKEMNFNFTPFHSCVWEEYFWLKVWYNGKYIKLPAYGKGRGYDDFVYKIRREGIWGKPIGSTETSRLLLSKFKNGFILDWTLLYEANIDYQHIKFRPLL